jgi:hypothetical protein
MQSFDPDPGSADSISRAVAVVQETFWRLLGLLGIAIGTSVLLGGFGGIIIDGISSDPRGRDLVIRNGSLELAGPPVSEIILVALFAALFYGAVVLAWLWFIAAAVRIVRGHQNGETVSIGTSLTETWPRAWRVLVLGLAATFVLGLLWAIFAAVYDVNEAFGALFGLVVFAASIAAYTAFLGLYGWVLSPSDGERKTPTTQTDPQYGV